MVNITFEDNLDLDNIVELDLDDLLGNMPSSAVGVKAKNVVEDPYKNNSQVTTSANPHPPPPNSS